MMVWKMIFLFQGSRIVFSGFLPLIFRGGSETLTVHGAWHGTNGRAPEVSFEHHQGGPWDGRDWWNGTGLEVSTSNRIDQ